MRARNGLPRFARLAHGGAGAAIVAFGTSLTQGGHYLTALLGALFARTGNARIRLINRGLRGYCTAMAPYRVASDVLPAAPDLVLLEFAHNDLARDALREIPASLHGIVAQVRAAYPNCEFAFVYLAAPGTAAAGPTPAMDAYEQVAEHFGFPSIDLATATEALVARGGAVWSGTPEALTTDGIHHTAAAARLIGEPFAAAFAQLVSPVPDAPLIAAIPSPYERAAWRPATALIGPGEWAVGVPHGHASRNADAYADAVAQPLEATAQLRFAFEGLRAFAWTMGGTTLDVRYGDGRGSERVELASGNVWAFTALTPYLERGLHTIEIVRGDGPAVFGDVCVLGAFAAPAAA